MLSEAKKGARKQILEYFRSVAEKENNQNNVNTVTLENLLDKDDPRKKLLIVAPESIGDVFIITSLLESFRISYPKIDWVIYFATNLVYFPMLNGNINIDHLIPYHSTMDHEIAMTGQGDNKGIFDAYSFIPALTQRFLSYLTNNNIALNLKP